MQVEAPGRERLKELMAKKRKVLSKIKRTKRALVKARLEKNKINAELKAHKERFAKMTPDEARAAVAEELDSISTDDIFPKKLERDFDRLDKKGNRQDDRHVVDLTGHDTGVDGADGSGVSLSREQDGDVMVLADAGSADETDDVPDIDISEEEAESEDEVIDLSNE